MSVSEPENPAQVPGDAEEELTTTGRIVSSKYEWVVYVLHAWPCRRRILGVSF